MVEGLHKSISDATDELRCNKQREVTKYNALMLDGVTRGKHVMWCACEMFGA